MSEKNSTSKQRKQPERQCMGCNEKKLKKGLIRIGRTPEGSGELDFTGKKSGRGAYVCHSLACLKKARKSGRVGRVLECNVTDEVWNMLEEEISD